MSIRIFDTLYPVHTISKITCRRGTHGSENDSITVHRTQDLSDDVFYVAAYNANLDQAMLTIQNEWNALTNRQPTNPSPPQLDANFMNSLFSQAKQMAQELATPISSNPGNSSSPRGRQIVTLTTSDEVKKELEVD